MKHLINFIEYDSLNESRGSDLAVKTVVRDIVYLLKSGHFGKATLPFDSTSKVKYQVIEPPKDLTQKEIEQLYKDAKEDPDDEMEIKRTIKYKFDNFPVKFSVGLIVLPNYKIREPRIDGDVGSEFTLEQGERVVHHDIKITIILNPRRELEQFLYKVISDLNITVAHEMEHLLQDYYDEEFQGDSNAKGLAYYTLPVEVPAQVAGFKRIYDLKKKDFPNMTFDYVVRDWFERRRYRTKLDLFEEEQVINNIVSEYKRKYRG